jgi:hypothetical protein
LSRRSRRSNTAARSIIVPVRPGSWGPDASGQAGLSWICATRRLTAGRPGGAASGPPLGAASLRPRHRRGVCRGTAGPPGEEPAATPAGQRCTQGGCTAVPGPGRSGAAGWRSSRIVWLNASPCECPPAVWMRRRCARGLRRLAGGRLPAHPLVRCPFQGGTQRAPVPRAKRRSSQGCPAGGARSRPVGASCRLHDDPAQAGLSGLPPRTHLFGVPSRVEPATGFHSTVSSIFLASSKSRVVMPFEAWFRSFTHTLPQVTSRSG